MSYHLAALIDQVETDTVTTSERIEIVRLILDLWAHRRDLPRRLTEDPFKDLQRTMLWLTEKSPWPQLHRRYLGADDPDPVLTPVQDDGPSTGETGETESEVDDRVEDAADEGYPSDFVMLLELTRAVEASTREATMRLLWMAADQARDFDARFLDAADRIKESLETRTATTLRRHAHLERRLRLRALATDLELDEDDDTLWLTDGADQATKAAETDDLLSDTSLATELRRCATALLAVAETLDQRATEAT